METVRNRNILVRDCENNQKGYMNADTETGNSDKLNESREGVRRVSLVVGKRERGDGGG